MIIDKRSGFGKWYVRSIYANIAVQVKLCHDHKEANDDKEYLYAWSQLMKFWDALTRREQYKDIDEGCFSANLSSAKRRRTGNDSSVDLNALVQSDVARPPKTTADTSCL
ncbi:uncharacterized protein N7515_009372 [Penicillium bovifimosum]|uniref:Uncharacterized protein n=1 Tax=Penicillium bovifimosum TaxID=126998 RepID=A0A9W9GJH9_9EURO|nr:uncharacterized protein N7515_009372 [Penicillium bovifimosum]KAJ5121411.1 hypothetical protein N7515_009372 [Penicillium bovifimosum]